MPSSIQTVASQASVKSINIVIVEDHEATRMAVETLLGWAFPDSHVQTASCAEDAIALCKAQAPELVIMDIALPGMNGIEAARHITSNHPGTRVVMHSNSDMPIYREESKAAGACAFVSKGRTSSELVQVIAAIFKIESAARSGVWRQ